jgi:glycosyltransferase involved in cell wall biosynthesis
VKSILFVTHKNPQGYRIQHYFPYLEKRGFQVALMTTESGFLTLLGGMRQADIVYVQRLLFDPIKLHLVRAASAKIVFDFDDAVMFGIRGESPTRRRKFGNMVTKADAVFGGNRFLCEEAERYRQDNVFYVPTVVNPDDYITKTADVTDRPVVGWIGSASTLRYVEPIVQSLLKSAPELNVLFKVIADKPLSIESPAIGFERWTKDGEKTALSNFDVGIMPLDDDLWSRGKCGLKLLQYMASGLPSIASPVGVAREIMEDGVNGFLCQGINEWTQTIEMLAADPYLRQTVGSAARRTVAERYSIQVWGPRIATMLDSL